MPKNIVLCSDGTGNKGGSGSDTNVFKIYQAVKVNDFEKDERRQIVFYDNGVGTSKLNVAKALGGGLGLGFRDNVRDLYDFLGRHYVDGDDVYIFGFSRGAATVRALAGMVEHCGLVIKHPVDRPVLEEDEFTERVKAAMDYYKHRRSNQKLGFEYGKKIQIEFMGVWDTVSALGVPQLPWLDNLLNLIRRHKFYDYEPATCVKNVYHPIALDDERRTFWPMVWKETSFKGDNIEQVWFSGMHSNVGGGYPREEVANVTLDWMMQKLKTHCERLRETDETRGLCLKDSAQTNVHADASPDGKVYNSRSGFSIFYRYQPRPVEDLCRDADNTPIRIHTSVIDRLQHRTAGYTPCNLPAPGDFTQVGPGAPPAGGAAASAPAGSAVAGPPAAEGYEALRTAIDSLKNSRISLYWVFLFSSLATLAGSLWLWVRPAVEAGNLAWREHWLVTLGEEGLRYLLPAAFDNAITYLVLDHPERLAIVLVYAAVLYGLRVALQMGMEGREGKARLELLKRLGRPV